MRDRVRRLAFIAGFVDEGADDAINLAERGAIADDTHRFAKNLKQQIEQAIVFGSERARANILGEVGPVAVGADPNFDERWLVFLHGAIAGGGESGDAFT